MELKDIHIRGSFVHAPDVKYYLYGSREKEVREKENELLKRFCLGGAATASYQIEGAWNEDGKGLNIWDVYSHKPGNIYGGHTGDVACDHYHRFKEDVALMRDLGIKAYRFSISWTRIFPDGTGKINEKGVKYAEAYRPLLVSGRLRTYRVLP